MDSQQNNNSNNNSTNVGSALDAGVEGDFGSLLDENNRVTASPSRFSNFWSANLPRGKQSVIGVLSTQALI